MACAGRAPIVLLRVLLSSLLLASVAAAQPVRLDLSEALRRAERGAPALGPRRAGVASAGAVARAADSALSLPPRLELEAGPRWHGSAGELGVDATVGGWVDLPLGGVGTSRQRFASSHGREARARLDVGRHDARQSAALAWIDARLARELVRIRTESLAHAESILRVAGARVRAGSAAPSEESVARATVGRAKAELIEARGLQFVADAELRFATGLGAGTEIEVVGPLEAKDKGLERGPLMAAARGVQPDVALAEAAADSRLRAAEMVLASGKPHLSIGPSVTREATGDWLLLARVTVPLPLVNPMQLEAARARSEADVARAESRFSRELLLKELALGLEEREHTREMRDTLRTGAIAPAREALRQSLSQYEAGSGDSATVLAARRELLAAEERWASAAADVRRADVRLARIVGKRPGEISGDGQ